VSANPIQDNTAINGFISSTKTLVGSGLVKAAQCRVGARKLVTFTASQPPQHNVMGAQKLVAFTASQPPRHLMGLEPTASTML